MFDSSMGLSLWAGYRRAGQSGTRSAAQHAWLLSGPSASRLRATPSPLRWPWRARLASTCRRRRPMSDVADAEGALV